MTIITATDFRKNMAQHIKTSKNNSTPITVTTQKEGAVVVIPMEQWTALRAPLYRMGSPANKSRLDTAITDIRDGKFTIQNIDI
jgi:PHD/YefM family antitoxin component YafN of YafNO toxin-antitoxin module